MGKYVDSIVTNVEGFFSGIFGGSVPEGIIPRPSLGVVANTQSIGTVVNSVSNALPSMGKTVTHVVRRGETLSNIASMHGVDYKDIAKANGITNPNNIYVGQRLKIPNSTKTPTPKPSPKPPSTIKPIADETKIDSKGVGCEKCYCYRDFTVDEVKKIVEALKKSEGYALPNLLFEEKNCILNKSDRTYERFTIELNKTFAKYKINTCIRKAHFLAQAYLETARFTSTKELGSIDNYLKKKSYYPYYGRGLMQLTWSSNYLKYKNNSNIDCITNPNIIDSNLENSVDSAGWFWEHGSAWGGLNKRADNDDIYKINIGVNGGFNGFKERITYIKKLIILMKIKNCKNLKLKKDKTLGIYKYSTSSIRNTNYGKTYKTKFESYDD